MTLVPGRDRNKLNPTCYNFCNTGNLAYNFSEAGFTGTCSIQVIHSIAHNHIQENYPINDNWFLLDTCYLSNVLKNASLEKNVRKCNAEENLLILKNRRQPYLNQMGMLLHLPMTVQIYEYSMENILSFSEVFNISGVHINMET